MNRNCAKVRNQPQVSNLRYTDYISVARPFKLPGPSQLLMQKTTQTSIWIAIKVKPYYESHSTAKNNFYPVKNFAGWMEWVVRDRNRCSSKETSVIAFSPSVGTCSISPFCTVCSTYRLTMESIPARNRSMKLHIDLCPTALLLQMHQSKCFSSYLGFLIARWQCMRIHAAIFRYKTAISVLPMRYGALSLTYFETPQTSKAFQFAPILFVLQNPRKFNPITPIRFPPFMFT